MKIYDNSKEGVMRTEPYHYRACGLDDIFLLNGFTLKESDYGPTVSIADIDGLHKAIGLSLISQPRPLGPREFRFLRKELDMTQKQLAGELGTEEQSPRRYEKGESKIPGPVDKIIRVIYVLSILSDDKKEQILEAIRQSIGESSVQLSDKQEPLCFKSTQQGWEGEVATT